MAIAILGMIGGVFIGILFGANEAMFKDKIARGLASNQTIAAISVPAEKEKALSSEADKIWRYYQRYHFHSTGIGAMSLAVLLMLFLRTSGGRLRDIASYLVAIGGFLYPFVWLFAAMAAPEIGRAAAKEKYMVFAMGGGLFLVGLVISLVHLMTSKPQEKKRFFNKKQRSNQKK